VLQAIEQWRYVVGQETPQALLAKHGCRHLLFTATVLCAKLARISYAHSLHLQLEAALLGAQLASAVFASSLSHPQREIDFAMYTPTCLCTGTDLFTDPFGLNLPDLLDGVETLARVLLQAGEALRALPVLSLFEWAAYHVHRSSHATLKCRFLRVEALCALGRLSEAYAVTFGLMHGSELPDSHISRDLTFAGPDGTIPAVAAVQPFRSTDHPGSVVNKEAVAALAQGRMRQEIASHYGPWVCAQVMCARARVLIALGCVPFQWRLVHPTSRRRIQAGDSIPDKVCLSSLVFPCNSPRNGRY
jgi:hypothetical protein